MRAEGMGSAGERLFLAGEGNGVVIRKFKQDW